MGSSGSSSLSSGCSREVRRMPARSRKVRKAGACVCVCVCVQAYSLGEVGSDEQVLAAARRLWAHTTDILVVVEPGTPRGYQTVMLVRDAILREERTKERRALRRMNQQGRAHEPSASSSTTGVLEEISGRNDAGLMLEGAAPEGATTPQLEAHEMIPHPHDQPITESNQEHSPSSRKQDLGQTPGTVPLPGAHVVAPCPHDQRCPMEDSGAWCHFAQRVTRLPIQRQAKRLPGDPIALPTEVEKFAYVALRRGLRPPQDSGALLHSGWDRVTREPRRRGGHVLLDLCKAAENRSGSAVAKQVVSKGKAPAAYRCARDTHWGDLWHSES